MLLRTDFHDILLNGRHV